MPEGELSGRAAGVLRGNDAGGWTKASPDLYPHQWSWDSAFIALGWARLDTGRAASELRRLFDHQWKNGKVPHIVFNPDAPAESYFPGPEHWISAADSPDAPDFPTSCLCQPPVHAIAARRIWDPGFLEEIYPRLLHWHRYLAEYRDPEGSGLVTIYHPWESGTDNSPRWDAALKAVEVGDFPSYIRRDLGHVDDPSQRPSEKDYERYLWLVELIKRNRCDEEEIPRSYPFMVKDVLFSAIFAAANEALLEISEFLGAPEREELEGWLRRTLEGISSCHDRETGLALDYDVRTEKPLRALTVAGFAPLIAGKADPLWLEGLLRRLDSGSFLGNEGLRWHLPPSASPQSPGFHPRSYWRGPVWPVINWLFWWALLRLGERERADRLREASLQQISTAGFAEYLEPFTGEPLGSKRQSWTAAVALDWLEEAPPS